MIDIKWNVNQIEAIKSIDGKERVVVKVYYSATATSGSFTASHQSVTELNYIPNGGVFIEYEDLSEEIVLGWVFDNIGIDNKLNIEKALIDKIEALLSTPTEVLPLPWAQTYDEIEAVQPPDPNYTPPESEVVPVVDNETLFPTMIVEEPPAPVDNSPDPFAYEENTNE